MSGLRPRKLGLSLGCACVLTWLAAAIAGAQALPSGDYRCRAEIGTVLLDGRYPLLLGDLSGTLDLTTAPSGALAGRAVLLDFPFEVEGRIKSGPGAARLVLVGEVGGMTFRATARLRGGAFVGIATMDTLQVPFQIDVSASGPLRPDYSLALEVNPDGTVGGSGFLTAARQQVSLEVSGQVSATGAVALKIRGPHVFLKTTAGTVSGADIAVGHWVGRAFGARVAGSSLRITPSR